MHRTLHEEGAEGEYLSQSAQLCAIIVLTSPPGGWASWHNSFAERCAMTEGQPARRVVQVKGHVIGPLEPKPRNLKPVKITDFVGVPGVYLDVAKKLSSPLLMGPPICEELMGFIRHLFTEEEAGVVRHLSVFSGKSSEDLARAERRDVEQLRPILHTLAIEKRAITATGTDGDMRYKLLPVFPGIFEMVLIGVTPEKMTDWHRRFAELFELLYNTGYSLEYMTKPSKLVRFVPVGQSIESHPMALPFDRMAAVMDRYDDFGVGQCQCRMLANVHGHGCGKALENCLSMGTSAQMGIERGWLRKVSKQEAIEIKARAEAEGLVSWLLNVESTKAQHSCSCCGCCCKAMRLVNEFNAPGMMAPPHFRPRFDLAKCTSCGRCAKACPMGSITVDKAAKKLSQKVERCIGCGLCVLACDTARAISMEPVPDHEMPYKSMLSMLVRTTPGRLWTALKVWKGR
jgi:Pyruvate/2-oxoacid:ferredoxin oxidoreductase delta subunit